MPLHYAGTRRVEERRSADRIDQPDDPATHETASVSGAARQPRQVQIFGTRKSADTRKALRFFAERRILTHFVDLQERAPALGELRRFAERFGAQSLVDRDSRRFLDLGLQRSLYSDDWWLRRLAEEPAMLRQPLVRFGPRVSVGLAESTWREWLQP